MALLPGEYLDSMNTIAAISPKEPLKFSQRRAFYGPYPHLFSFHVQLFWLARRVCSDWLITFAGAERGLLACDNRLNYT